MKSTPCKKRKARTIESSDSEVSESENCDDHKAKFDGSKRYSFDELIADETLFKSLIDMKKEDLQNQLAKKTQHRQKGKPDEGTDVVICNDNTNNRNVSLNNQTAVRRSVYSS